MTVLVIVAAVIVAAFVLKRALRPVLVRHKISREAGESVVVSTLSAFRERIATGGEITVSGPTRILVSRHPEDLYRAADGEFEVSLAFMPKKGTWWVKWKALNEPAIDPIELEFPKRHPASADLEALAKLIVAHQTSEAPVERDVVPEEEAI